MYCDAFITTVPEIVILFSFPRVMDERSSSVAASVKDAPEEVVTAATLLYCVVLMVLLL